MDLEHWRDGSRFSLKVTMSAPPPMVHPGKASPPPPEVQIGLLMVGCFLSLLTGICVALSMVVQRYAITGPTYRLRFLCCTMPRPYVGYLGLLFYFGANGMLAATASSALPLPRTFCTFCTFCTCHKRRCLQIAVGPLSLFATLFLLLVVWNAMFANRMLGEPLDTPRVVGCILIVFGAVFMMLPVLGGFNPPAEFTVDDIDGFMRDTWGMTYFVLILTTSLALACLVLWFERAYDLTEEEKVERSFRCVVSHSRLIHKPHLTALQPPFHGWLPDRSPPHQTQVGAPSVLQPPSSPIPTPFRSRLIAVSPHIRSPPFNPSSQDQSPLRDDSSGGEEGYHPPGESSPREVAP